VTWTTRGSAGRSGPTRSRPRTVERTRELMPNPAQRTAAFPWREGEMYQIAGEVWATVSPYGRFKSEE